MSNSIILKDISDHGNAELTRMFSVISLVSENTENIDACARSLTAAAESLFRNVLTGNLAEDVPFIVLMPPFLKARVKLTKKLFNHLKGLVTVCFARFPHSPVAFLGSSDHGVQLIGACTSSVRKKPSYFNNLELANLVRQALFREISNDTKAFFDAPEGSFFALPNNLFAKRFWRPGNMQMRMSNLDLMYFWMFPLVAQSTHLLAETWSISTLIGHCAKRLQQQTNTIVEVAYLGPDNSSLLGIKHTLEAALNSFKLNAYSKLCYIQSAGYTGETLARFQSLVETDYPELFERFSFITLVRLGFEDSDRYVFDASKTMTDCYKDATRFSSKDVCIAVDPKTFMPLFTQVTTKTLRKKEHATRHVEFIQRYAGKEIFKLHRDVFRDGYAVSRRHNAFFVEFGAMLTTEEFKERIGTHASTLADRKFDYILTTQTRNNLDFIDVLIKKLNFAGNIISLNHFSELPRSLPPVIQDTDTILVVESVSLSGETLKGYHRGLRQINNRARIDYLVGLVRPDRPAEWDRRAIELATGPEGQSNYHSVIILERVVLPDWDKQKCPWCSEYRLYEHIEASKMSPTLAEQFYRRRDNLERGSEKGIHIGAWLHSDDIGAAKELQFSDGSLFLDQKQIRSRDGTQGKPSDADIIFAVSSAIQTWRSETSREIVLQPRIERMLFAPAGETESLDLFTIHGSTTFNDAALRSAIWRCLKHDDILPRPSADISALKSFLVRTFQTTQADIDYQFRLEAVLLFGRFIAANRQDILVSEAESHLISMLLKC